MRILHLCSDWKWTGPAEPMVLAIQALRARGHRVELACAEPPEPGLKGLAEEARQRGVAPRATLAPRRGARPLGDLAEARRLARLLRWDGFEIVHAWHTRDQALALQARLFGSLRTRPALVRSLPAAERVRARPWSRLWLGAAVDGLHCPSPVSAARNAALRGGRPVRGCLGAIDPGRWRAGDGKAIRRELGIAQTAPVVGIASRVQPHRRFDLLVAALEGLLARHPEARLLVLGRGTHLDRVAREPARRRGLEGRVVFAGQRGDDYVDALAAMDLFTMVVPGSDGTCRALLEAAAAGLPAVVSRREALPEIVVDRETGLLTDEDPAAFAAAWAWILDDPLRRRRLGEAARARASRLFRPERLAADLEALYAEVLGAAPPSESPTSSR